MSVVWERFSGDTAGFAVKLSFHADPDNGRGADADVAASWGALQVWVDGLNLCMHTDQGETIQAAHWYLLPILEWLVTSWDPLLHEERLPSASSQFETAADFADSMTTMLFDELPTSHGIELDTRRYDWEQRHSLRSARDGGLLPDIRFRRLRDRIEVSWNNRPLAGAGEVEFASTHGRSYQEPAVVANALFEVLSEGAKWLAARRPESQRVDALVKATAQLSAARRTDERVAWLAGLGATPAQIIDRWRSVAARAKRSASREAFDQTFGVSREGRLVLGGTCEAALLFGSASPTISEEDAFRLANLLLDRFQAEASDKLREFARYEPVTPETPPWEQGYELAEELLDGASELLLRDLVDIEGFLSAHEVMIQEAELSDRSIRAVSFVSPHHPPTIAINTASRYFSSSHATRFTLAHELCHLLFDRSQGSRLAVASGPWAPRVIEQRANAFAAMLLMPPGLLGRAIEASREGLTSALGVQHVATRLGVGSSALVEHAHNMGLLDEVEREDLRQALDRVR